MALFADALENPLCTVHDAGRGAYGSGALVPDPGVTLVPDPGVTRVSVQSDSARSDRGSHTQVCCGATVCGATGISPGKVVARRVPFTGPWSHSRVPGSFSFLGFARERWRPPKPISPLPPRLPRAVAEPYRNASSRGRVHTW